ncbi:MAG: hypothetical protein M3R05_01285 [Chloroflexota bacterium]|nr:hypothetical protein [Chloroflexota bacterium]
MKRTATTLIATGLLLAGCSGGPGDSPGASPAPGSDITHPTGNALVLSVAFKGGFVAPDFRLGALPSFVLTGDGRVLVPGAQIEIFPGPALPSIQERRLTEAGIQAILRAVAQTGLFKADLDLRGANAMVADASDTVFTLHADAREVTVSVYALGMLDVTNPPPGLSRNELLAHRALTTLDQQLQSLEQWLPADAWADTGWKPYQPEALRLHVRNADAEPPDAGGGLPPQAPRAWPIAGDPVSFGKPMSSGNLRCGVVAGAVGATWLAELRQSNQLTRWTAGGHRYSIIPRPLLPHEERSCAEPLPGG